MEFAGKALQIDAVIAGAQKCATTSLAAALAAHPGVCLARGKEAHLFDRHDVQQDGPSQIDLEEFFAHRTPHQLLLDATPSYMYLPGCIEALVRHNPDVRVLVVLRNPAERAVSHYFHERRNGNERLPLALALLMEKFRLQRDCDPLGPRSAHRHSSYIDRGRYELQLARMSHLTKNVHVVDFDSLTTDPPRELEKILSFLRLEPFPSLQLPRLNTGSLRTRMPGDFLARWMTRNLHSPTTASS